MIVAAALLGGCAGAPLPRPGDPFGYCAAVGTIDAPDARYAGPAVPAAIAEGLRRAFGAPPDAPVEVFTRGTSWRCMGGKVYACTVGANLPCDAKADTSREPSAPITDFCREHLSADVVPMVVTGRATVYEWRCEGSAPAIARQVTRPDPRGYLANIWHEIPPPR